MKPFLAWLLRQMLRARLVFAALYAVSAAGFLYADPRAGWTWFIVIAGALLCLLFWGLVTFWQAAFTRRRRPEGRTKRDHV